MNNQSLEIDFSTHKPEPCSLFYNAKHVLGDVFEGLDIAYMDEDDEYGAWIEISNRNEGVSLGIAFISGELYELYDSALAYRDYAPYWSPVVKAPTESVRNLYKRITGITYPVFRADGLNVQDFNRLIALKREKGFAYEESAFIKVVSEVKHYLVNLHTILPEETKSTTYFVEAKDLEEAGKLAVMLESPNPHSLQKDGCHFVEPDNSCSYIADSVELVEEEDVPVLSKYIMPMSAAVVSQEAYRYWDTPECPFCGEKAEEPFLEKGEAFRYRCSNGHSVVYMPEGNDNETESTVSGWW